MPISRLRIAKDDIVKIFDQSPTRVYTRSSLAQVLVQNREYWRLAQSTTTEKLAEFLEEYSKMRRVAIEFPWRKEIRYHWGEISAMELAQSLKPNSYLSHYSAMLLNQLTLQIPKTIYVNVEQTPKKRPQGVLEQSAIDRAFQRPPRETTNIAAFDDHRICLLSGMATGLLGVEQREGSTGFKIMCTGIDRTLIDITVRPFYAGGVQEVARAFEIAAEQLSINRICSYLTKLNYIYPYHQAIGYYLERTKKFTDEQLALLRQFPIEFDFYLEYGMRKRDYVKKWRLFVPEGF